MRMLRATDDQVLALGFSPESRVLVAHHSQGLFAWNLDGDGLPVRLSHDRYSPCRDLFFDPDGHTVYWMTQTGRVAADLHTGQRHPTVSPLRHGAVWFAQTPDARRLFSAHRPNPELFAWHSDGISWTRDWCEPIADALPNAPALDPTGERLAYLGEKPGPRWWPEYNQLVIVDAATGAEIGHGNYRYGPGECRLLFSPNGRQLIGLHNMTLLIWTAPKWGPPHVCHNTTRKHFTAAAFEPSGRYLYTTSNDASVIVWDATTWEHTRRYTWAIGKLKSITVSPDGSLAAAGADDGSIIVWDLD